MSNLVYPTLPGQAWPRVRTPSYKTESQTSDSGRAWHVSRMLYAVYKIKLTYDYLNAADYAQLLAFFKRHKARGESWLFDDRDDRVQNDSASPQAFGVGDGVRTRWQLVRSLGGIVEPIGRHNAISSVRINASATAAYTLDDYGFITFNTAPANGAVLDWQGTFYWRCVFASDTQSFDEFLRFFYSAKSVEFQTWKA
jgi:uncharacterized protein (TIGR02217 family)